MGGLIDLLAARSDDIDNRTIYLTKNIPISIAI